MFSMALSMILYGMLVRSPALGSTDGFNLRTPTLSGLRGRRRRIRRPGSSRSPSSWRSACAIFAAPLPARGHGLLGRGDPRERDPRRVSRHLGARASSTRRTSSLRCSPALGGALSRGRRGHIDPELAYWTTSGEFVFVAILSGIGHVAAPFVGMVLFELIRSFAFQYSPYTWQMVGRHRHAGGHPVPAHGAVVARCARARARCRA